MHDMIYFSCLDTIRSRSQTGRTWANPEGNGRAKVLLQNILVIRLLYIIIYATKRGIYWVMEQPASSVPCLILAFRWQNQMAVQMFQLRFFIVGLQCEGFFNGVKPGMAGYFLLPLGGPPIGHRPSRLRAGGSHFQWRPMDLTHSR